MSVRPEVTEAESIRKRYVRKLLIFMPCMAVQLSSDVAALVIYHVVGDVPCPGSVFLRPWLSGIGHGFTVVHALGCFSTWKLARWELEDNTGHCKWMMMFLYTFIATGWSGIWMMMGINASFNGVEPNEHLNGGGCHDLGTCDEGCTPELWHAARGLAWYYIAFLGVFAIALVSAVGYACTHPQVISETLQI